ncbi:MAG: ABC transporter substrate-binding protein [Chloroflexota bacterium]|nr:MAG: ABC transporter substrate-binding protein [Chloroflexota bacterium]
MKKRLVLVVGCLIVASLIITGCGNGGETVLPVEKEKPEYGGVLNLAVGADPTGFDDALQPHYACGTLKLTNEELWEGDWTKGRAGGYGSGESDWYLGGSLNRLEHKGGSLAESWEITDKDTITFHIRKGVHWHDKPPANGRELTADDIVFSLNRQYTFPSSYMKRSYPKACETTEISAPDDYTVVVKCDPAYFGDVVTMIDYMDIYPREAIEEFGDLSSWEDSIGTGPFILTDYVSGNVMTFVRNPNYWRTNPVGPGEGDQLPYVDGMKLFIMPDESTRVAAFRTGKLDLLTLDWELAQEFVNTPNPKHEYIRYLDDGGQATIYMRTDKKDSPLSDKRVRQALYLAIDNQKILDEYYGGQGTLLKWPIMQIKEYANAYVPLEELPESVQELYGHNPEKAKQLLADAGYPDGFKVSIVCYNQRAWVDILTMVKAMWADVGVELEIDAKEYGPFTSIIIRRAYDEMLFGFYSGCGTYFKAINYTGPGMYNGSYVDDPVLNKARDEMAEAFPDEAKVDQLHRELMPYLLEQVYTIALPAGYTYRAWWPWVKNYSGEASLGYYNALNGSKYLWIDQELKDAMLGK